MSNLDLSVFIKNMPEPKHPEPLFNEIDKPKLSFWFLNTANELVMKATNQTKGLDMSPKYQEFYKQLMRHTNRSINSELNVYNGIGFMGKYGVGKTLMLKSIRQIYVKLGIPSKYLTAFELVEMYRLDNLNKTHDFKKLCDRRDITIFIDELGDEPQKSNTYGNEESVMYRFLKIKLDQLESGDDFKIYFTTNLNEQQLTDIYGARAFSRMSAYVNILDLATFENLRNE